MMRINFSYLICFCSLQILLSKPAFRFPSMATVTKRHGKEGKVLIKFAFMYKHTKVTTLSCS